MGFTLFPYFNFLNILLVSHTKLQMGCMGFKSTEIGTSYCLLVIIIAVDLKAVILKDSVEDVGG